MGINLEQKQWDDMQVAMNSVRGGSYASYKGSEVLYMPKTGSTIYFSLQMSHSWDLITPLEPHVHIIWPAALSGNVEMTLTYSWADIGSNFPNATSDVQIFASPVVANRHGIFGFDDPDPQDHNIREVSSVLLCSLTRSSGGNDTYGGSIYIPSIDFHYLKDSNGSTVATHKRARYS